MESCFKHLLILNNYDLLAYKYNDGAEILKELLKNVGCNFLHQINNYPFSIIHFPLKQYLFWKVYNELKNNYSRTNSF